LVLKMSFPTSSSTFFKLTIMEKNKETLFNTAKEKLSIANQELFKPNEDVVGYSVCKNSQVAIESYLKGYLQHRGFTTHDEEQLEGLLNRCKDLDPKFNRIDMSVIDCKAAKMDSRYCSDVEKVSTCFDVADSLDTLLRQLEII